MESVSGRDPPDQEVDSGSAASLRVLEGGALRGWQVAMDCFPVLACRITSEKSIRQLGEEFTLERSQEQF